MDTLWHSDLSAPACLCLIEREQKKKQQPKKPKKKTNQIGTKRQRGKERWESQCLLRRGSELTFCKTNGCAKEKGDRENVTKTSKHRCLQIHSRDFLMTAEEMTKKKQKQKNAVYRSYQSIYCITACEMIGQLAG